MMDEITGAHRMLVKILDNGGTVRNQGNRLGADLKSSRSIGSRGTVALYQSGGSRRMIID